MKNFKTYSQFIVESKSAKEEEEEKAREKEAAELITIVDQQSGVDTATETKRINERKFTEEERKELAKKGLALPNGSFPIVNVEDLKAAILSYGMAKNKAEAAKWIAKRAKALGADDLIPDTPDFNKALKEVATRIPAKTIAFSSKEDEEEDETAAPSYISGTTITEAQTDINSLASELGTKFPKMSKMGNWVREVEVEDDYDGGVNIKVSGLAGDSTPKKEVNNVLKKLGWSTKYKGRENYSTSYGSGNGHTYTWQLKGVKDTDLTPDWGNDWDIDESITEADKEWSDDVKTKWSPPKGTFTKPAKEVAAILKKGSKDLQQAMARLNFYINRAGDNLDKKTKAELEKAKKLLKDLY